MEPPCFEEDEYEYEYGHDVQSASSPPQIAKPDLPPLALSRTPSARPTSLPPHTRLPSKSHSLPYRSSPSYPGYSSSDDDEVVLSGLSDEDGEDDGDERGEYEDMFFHSLPNSIEFHARCASMPQPLPANDSQEACVSDQSEDSLQISVSLPSSGYVNIPTVHQSDHLNQTDTSSSVCADQSEGSLLHDNIQQPISSQSISDCEELQSSQATDTSSQANQLVDIPPLSQSECSEIQTDYSDGYIRMRDAESDKATNETIDKDTHGEEKKEERGEQETSCQEGQR